MRQHDDVAKEMPIVPAWLRASAAQQFVEVTRRSTPQTGRSRQVNGHRRCRTTLARHGQTQAPRQEDRGEEGSGREACTSVTAPGMGSGSELPAT